MEKLSWKKEMAGNSQLRERHITQLKSDHEKFLEEASQKEESSQTLVEKQIQTTDENITSLAKSSKIITNIYPAINILDGKKENSFNNGNHGHDLVDILKNFMKSWTVNSRLKLNANNRKLLKTAKNVSKCLTQQDFILLWPNENFTPIILVLKTYKLLCTFKSLSSLKQVLRVYQSNLSLYKGLIIKPVD